MKIYTKSGDKGSTSLLDGSRVSKSSLRVEAYGTLDELNSWVGYVVSISNDDEIKARLVQLQPFLHTACSDAASPYKSNDDTGPRVPGEIITRLENEIDRMTAELPELTRFILPGGNQTAAALHVCRTICRRAERRLIDLNENEGQVNPHVIRFINRLSDYLFTIARWANWRSGQSDREWIYEEDS